MKEKSPAVQWYPKQYLGDDKIIAMDWDARGMHHWLLNISWQQDPPGTLPDDMALISRWLGSPPDPIWRRVRPQIFSAWSLQDGRWVNSGMVRAWERQQKFSASRKKSSDARWSGVSKAIRNESENNARAQEDEEEVIHAVRFKVESPADDDDWGRLCAAHPKPEQSYIAQNRFYEATNWVAEKKSIPQKEAANYIIERAVTYASICKFQKGLTKWLEEKIFEQKDAAWGDLGGNNKSEQRQTDALKACDDAKRIIRGMDRGTTDHTRGDA